MMIAASQCDIEMCKLFIDDGADVNADMEIGLTALGHADEHSADWKYKELAVFLRSKGAKLSVKDVQEKTLRTEQAAK